MKMRNWILLAICLCSGMFFEGHAQDRQREMYGDSTREVKMSYIHSMEEACRQAYRQKKLIFVNCYADWAAPCLGMNQYVFSDEDFCHYMDKKFINLFVDMTSAEGKEIGKQYGVSSYAYYLILNYKGEVIQRIQGGRKLPEFKEMVNLALNKKTSLAGTRQKYESGKYTKKELYNYLRALQVAGADSLFKALGKEYMAMLDEQEYYKPENWIFAGLHKNRKGTYYQYLITHKPLFIKNIGEKKVNNYIESQFSSEILSYATGDSEYDAEALDRLHREMREAALPDTCGCEILYNIAVLRGKRKYHDLVSYLEQNGKFLDNYRRLRSFVELSLRLPDLKEAEKQELTAYLKQAAEREKGTTSRRLKELIEQVQKNTAQGINFLHAPFAKLLEKAKEEKKLIFVDCYTSWCGPCRSMANNVFTRPDVGEYFNARFINAKINMEKGEGKDLAKKYQINAFPTLLLIDAEGKVVEKSVGFKSSERLLEWAKNIKL